MEGGLDDDVCEKKLFLCYYSFFIAKERSLKEGKVMKKIILYIPCYFERTR